MECKQSNLEIKEIECSAVEWEAFLKEWLAMLLKITEGQIKRRIWIIVEASFSQMIIKKFRQLMIK